MSKTIDEKVVEMRFDNKQFEDGVATSMSTLDKLKKSLNLDGAAKGLDSLSDAAKKCDMSTLSRSVEAVQTKFSAMQVVAMTALSNITNSAMNAGKQLLSSLTVEPITTGFNEYELKMGSIQTIMASTGESLDRVNQKLDELNRYSDRTIYSFSDMTSNIGKFTNAGVKLDDAVAAIQGVSNVAAVSGANANEASRAMYNFAQALSAGYVKLIDWKSIENANMATVEFKTQLLESAVAAGTLTKTTDGMYKTIAKGTVIDATHLFNDSLQEQWMTTEVLTETLKDYADETTDIGKKAFAAAQDVKTWTQLLDTLKESAQSGWAETWQLVAGDYEEAKATLRTFSEFFSSIIDGSSEARNSLLQGALMSSWGQLKDRVNETGISVDTFRDTLRETAESSVDGLDKMIEEAGSFDATLSQGWLTTDILAETLNKVVSNAAGMETSISELSDEQLKNIGYTDGQIQALRALANEAQLSDSDLSKLVDTMGRQSGRELLFDSLLNGAKAVQSVFIALKGAWQEVFPPATSEQLYSIIEALHTASERLREFFALSEDGKPINQTFANIQSTFKGLFAVLDIVKQAFTALWSAVFPASSAVGGLLSGVLSLTGSLGELLVSLDEAIKENDLFGKGVQTIAGFIRGAISTVTEFARAVGEKFHIPSLDEAKESVKAFFAVLQEKVSIPGFELLQSIFDRICERVDRVKDAIVGMKNAVTSSFDEAGKASEGSKFVQSLSGIWKLVTTIASAITTVLGKAVSGLIDMIGNADFNGIMDFLNALAAGGLIAAIKKFLDPMSELGETFGSFKEWVEALQTGVTKVLDNVRGCLEAWQTKLKSEALLKIAEAIAILAASLLVLSLIDSGKLTASLAAITTLFIELGASLAVIDKLEVDGKAANKAASSMIKISAALLILSAALKNISSLNPEQMTVGLIGLAGMATVMVGTIAALEAASKKFEGGSLKGMMSFAVAIGILSLSMKSVAELDWNGVAKGLVGLAGMAAIMAGTIVALQAASNKYTDGAVKGLITFAAAIGLLTISFKSIANEDWNGIAKGLTGVAGLAAIMVATITALEAASSKYKEGSIKGLLTFAAAIGLLTISFKSIANEDWNGVAKGLTGVAGLAVIMSATIVALQAASSRYKDGAMKGLITFAASIGLLTISFKAIANEDWNGIAKGLTGVAGLAVIMSGALAALTAVSATFNETSMLKVASAMLVLSGSILVLTPAMKSLGSMSWESIAKGLIAIAGAFTVMGVAGAVLGPLAPTILTLAGALALIGVGAVAVGAGLTLIGTGLTSVSVGLTALATSLAVSVTAIVGGLSAIILGIAGLIPAIATKIGEAIVAFCGVITNGAPAIGEAVKAVVLSLVDVLVECVPAIADGALQLVTGVLAALVTYTPQIIDSVMQFLIEILEGIARNMPELIQAAMDVVGSFFEGVLSALSNIDTGTLIQGVAAIGLLTALVAALGAVAGLIPAAMVGVLGMGVVITELAVVLAAVGALAQIPGLDWLISEGGNLLQTIGTAIGGFVGGIVGGFMSGVSSSFPQIGADLASFMTNVQPFIDGASGIGPELLAGIGNLTGAILLITAADVIEGLTSWLTGGSSLADFGEELVPFGEAMVEFSNAISGLDADLVDKAATAGKTLAEMAATLPNSGGVVGFFAGENDMGTFGEQLVGFGESMMKFADSVKGLDTDTVQNAAIAGKAMAEMASTLPNSGGVVGFFAGENDMDAFGDQLVPFGRAVKEYSDAVSGLDVDAVVNSSTAGKAMTELANTIPNTGGAVAFFTGDNDMATFGEQLVVFGTSMKAYADAVAGLDTGAVSASASAGAALVELANTIPNTGGLVAFFTGDNDLAAFGESLAPFGAGMKAYSDSLSGFNAEVVTASASAAQALAALQSSLPNMGGLVDFFTGNNDLAEFGETLAPFGEAMKKYGESVSGLDQHSEAIEASVVAGTALSELSKTLPNVGGVIDFFTGGNDLGTFASGIVAFGDAMQKYGAAVSGLENYSGSIDASIIAGDSLIALSKSLPNVGGAIAFFTGGNDLGSFSVGIVEFGAAMKKYGEVVAGLEDYSGSIDASVVAGEALIELSKTLPNVGGVLDFFTGHSDLGTFSNGIAQFGEAMMEYGKAVTGLEDYSGSIDASVVAGSSLIELSKTLPNVGGVMDFFTGHSDLSTFSNGIVSFGNAMREYGDAVAGLEEHTAAIDASVVAGNSLIELAKTLPNATGAVDFFNGQNGLTAFGTNIVPFGTAMKQYGDAVAGLEAHTSAIEASVIAGGSLVELAKTLPNAGGAITFFTGGNDLGTFASGIVPFGTAMREYGNAVAGLEAHTGAIEASTIAGQSLVELAKTLPKCGGLAQVFTGESSLTSFGDQIVQFGKDLSAYAQAIDGVSAETVTASANAAKALSDLATGLPDSSLFDKWFGGDQTLSSFGKEISAFGNEMSSYYSKVSGIDISKLSGVITQVWSLVDLAKGVQVIDASGMSSFSNSLKAMANSGIKEFTSAFENANTSVTKAVQSMLNSVSSAISNGATLTTPGMESVMKSLADVVTKKAIEINKSVSTMMSGMATTIRNSSSPVQTAMRNVVSGAVTAINSLKGQFNTAGQNVGQGFVNGINSKNPAATVAGRNLGLAALNAAKKALDSHSPSREFIHLGENMGEGLAIGAKNSIVPASEATSTMIDEVLKVSSKGIEAFQKWAEEKKYYNELSLMDELAGYENLQKMYKAGSEERIKIDREIYRIQNELVASTYQASLDWIEKEKYYNRLSTQEELEAYERMQKRYIEGSEERMAIDKKIYALKKQLMDESYQHSMDWIEEEKYYNRMSLADELAAYKRVQSRYAKGTEERKKMDREVYRLEQEIYEAQQQYIADVQSAQEEANQKRISLEEEYADKVKSINDKLASDIKAANDKYQSALDSRESSLYSSYGLFDEVKEKEEVSGDTLMKNLEGQVKEFGEWQDILDSFSARGLDSELIGELQEMGPSAISQIKALNSMSDSELEKYASLWSIKHAQAREQAVSELEGLRIETQQNIAQLRSDAAKELEDYRVIWAQKLQQVNEDANAKLAKLRQEFGEKVGLIKKDTEKETQEMADAAKKILEEAGWDDSGKQIVTGIKKGVEEEKPSLLDALTQMALEGVEAVRAAWDEHSPSRVFQKLGNFAGLGLVNGLSEYADKSYDAGANVADSAKNGLSNAMRSISDYLTGDFDMQPTIRPVLDLTNVAQGAGQLDGLFNSSRLMSLANQTSFAFSANAGDREMTVKVDNDGVIEELRVLRGEMAEMTARLERMQIVLDTGTLVGQMADPMDAALGQKQALRGRGI